MIIIDKNGETHHHAMVQIGHNLKKFLTMYLIHYNYLMRNLSLFRLSLIKVMQSLTKLPISPDGCIK